VNALGEQNYSALFNNSEHFAAWCATGKRTSSKIVRLSGHANAVTSGTIATCWLASEVHSWLQRAAGELLTSARGGAFGGFAGWTRVCGLLACTLGAAAEVRFALSDTSINRAERQARVLAAMTLVPLGGMFLIPSISCTIPACLVSFLLGIADKRYQIRRRFGRWLLRCFPALADALEELFSGLRKWLMGTGVEHSERYQEALQCASIFLQLQRTTGYDTEDVNHAFRRMALRYHPDKRGGDPGLFHKAQYAKLLLLEHINNGQTWNGWLYACHFLDIPLTSSTVILDCTATSGSEDSTLLSEKHKVRVAQGTEYQHRFGSRGVLNCMMWAWLEQRLPCSHLHITIWNAADTDNHEPHDSSPLRDFKLHFFSHTQREPLRIFIPVPASCTQLLISARCVYRGSSILDRVVSGVGSSTFSFIISESTSPALPAGCTTLQQDCKSFQSLWPSRPWFQGVSEQRCALVIYDALGAAQETQDLLQLFSSLQVSCTLVIDVARAVTPEDRATLEYAVQQGFELGWSFAHGHLAKLLQGGQFADELNDELPRLNQRLAELDPDFRNRPHKWIWTPDRLTLCSSQRCCLKFHGYLIAQSDCSPFEYSPCAEMTAWCVHFIERRVLPGSVISMPSPRQKAQPGEDLSFAKEVILRSVQILQAAGMNIGSLSTACMSSSEQKLET